MKKYKIRMIISIIVASVLLLYVVFPLFSMAENEELKLELTKVEINGEYQINVAGSSPSKILALSYIQGRKTISEFNSNAEAIIAYFEGEQATRLNITTDNYINEVIKVTQYGTYTVYVRNDEGEIQLSYITIRDKSEIDLKLNIQQNENSKNILINATSTSDITVVKVLKTEDLTIANNFGESSNILNNFNTSIDLTYSVSEDGIYQVYVEDANKNKKIQTISVFDGTTPILINTEVNEKTVTINVKDSVADVEIIKIAKKSEIGSISDFESKGNVIECNKASDITVNYEVSEEGQYLIYAKDVAGNSRMVSATISSAPEQAIKFYKSNDVATIFAVVTNSKNNINFAKYMFSDTEKSIDEIKENGKDLEVAEGNSIVLKIKDEEVQSAKYIIVYVRDVLGYGKMSGRTISSIPAIDNLQEIPEQLQKLEETQPEPPPQIPTETQPEQQPQTETPEPSEQQPQEQQKPEQTQTEKTQPDEQAQTQEQQPQQSEQLQTQEQQEQTQPEQQSQEQPQEQQEQQTSQKSQEQQTVQGTTNSANVNNKNQSQTNQTANQDNNNTTTDTKKNGAIDLNNVEGDFSEIQEKSEDTQNDKTTENLKIDSSKSASENKYPQTGTNEYIIFIGIVIAIIVAIYSYIKMKQKK